MTPTWDTGYGDGSVISTSAILPGIKWAQDFEDKLPGAKPVKFIEVCSTKNKRATVSESNYSMKVTKNEYMGIGCLCKGTKYRPTDGSGCNHVKLVSDAKTIEFMLNTAIDRQTVATSSTRKAFESKSDSWYRDYES